MRTYEMIGCADSNTRTYESEYGTYSKKDKFKLSTYAEGLSKEKLLYNLFHDACWVLRKDVPKRKKMTQKQIEDELGYLIEIDDGEKENKSLPDNTSSNLPIQEWLKDEDRKDRHAELDKLFKMLFGLED